VTWSKEWCSGTVSGASSVPDPPDVSNRIMGPALWLPSRGLTKLSHPGKTAGEGSNAKKHWPEKH